MSNTDGAAGLLLNNKSYARSFALAHLAREELSKIVILHGIGCRLLAGVKIDWKALKRRLREHKAKLRLEIVQQALFLNSFGHTQTGEMLLKFASPAASYRNDRKNEALYFGIEERTITRPAACFNEKQAWRTVTLAKLALEEEQLIRAKVGRFADRPPGSMKDLKMDTLNPEQLLKIMKELGPQFRRLFEELEKAGEKERNEGC